MRSRLVPNNSKMKETVSKFPFTLSYNVNIRILARNHGIQVLQEFQTIFVFLN